MEEKEEFDFEEFKKQAIAGMYAGKPFSGEKGIFTPLMTRITEATFFRGSFSWELENHLAESKAKGIANRKNGEAIKQVKSLSGEFEL